MKDLIIEYRDGKLAELRVNGVLLQGVTSLELSHSVRDSVPELTISMGMTGEESLIPPRQDKKTVWCAIKNHESLETGKQLSKEQLDQLNDAARTVAKKTIVDACMPGGVLYHSK